MAAIHMLQQLYHSSRIPQFLYTNVVMSRSYVYVSYCCNSYSKFGSHTSVPMMAAKTPQVLWTFFLLVFILSKMAHEHFAYNKFSPKFTVASNLGSSSAVL